ncbi:hypothetical protein BDZ89DRAFT_1076633, partial [Hymenopellis radicata]
GRSLSRICSRCNQVTIIVITDVGAAKHGAALVGGPDDANFHQVGCQFTKCRNATCGDFKRIDPSGFTTAQLERMPGVIYWLRERERLLATVPPTQSYNRNPRPSAPTRSSSPVPRSSPTPAPRPRTKRAAEEHPEGSIPKKHRLDVSAPTARARWTADEKIFLETFATQYLDACRGDGKAFVIDNVLLPFRAKFKPDFTVSELQEKLVTFFKNSKKNWLAADLYVPAPPRPRQPPSPKTPVSISDDDSDDEVVIIDTIAQRRLTFATFLKDNAPPQVFELEVAATGPIQPTNYLKQFGRHGVHAGLHLEQYIPELMEFRPFRWQSALNMSKAELWIVLKDVRVSIAPSEWDGLTSHILFPFFD